jgi:ribonuclease PH
VVRADGRGDESLREIKITRGYQQWPAGSVLVEFGNTRVLCAASVNDGVPRWRAGSGLGWVTAEYAMLPSATHTRGDRESVKGKIGGRTHEISRLIGRALRACIDLSALGENTIVIDCDVIQADGGTRTAAITGAYVALADAITWLEAAGRLADPKPLSCSVSAVSVGVIDGRVRLDLPYEEDARAEVDMNVVATDAGTLVEVQGTGEGATFARSTLDQMLDLALAGCAELTRLQTEALALPYPGQLPEPSPKGRRKS